MGKGKRTTIDIKCGYDFTGRPERHVKSCPMYKEYPSAHSNRGEGYKGSQVVGYSGGNSGNNQIDPKVAKQLINQINANESAIQNEIARLRGLNPIADEDTLRTGAIVVLGIASIEEYCALKEYQKFLTSPDSVKSIISQNAINREIQKDNQIKQLVNEYKGKYPNASEKSLRDIADYVAYGDNHYNDLTYFAQGHLLGDSGEVFGLPIMGNATSIKEYKEVKKSLENAGYYFEYVHNSSVQGGKGYWVKVGIADRIFKNTSKDNYSFEESSSKLSSWRSK